MFDESQYAQIILCCQDLVRAESMTGREGAAAAVLERWMHEPFGGDLDGGQVWGRGATDMKGSVAAMVCAAAFVPRAALRGTITVSGSVVEEELEGQVLAELLQQHPADLVVIGESTMLDVGYAEKGRAGIRIVAHGRPAHSASPHLGDNAIYKMTEVIARLRALAPPIDEILGPGILELVEIISNPYPGTSIVPDRCTVKWDRRLVRGETRESVLAGIRAELEGIPGVEVSYLKLAIPCYTGVVIEHDDFHPAWNVDQGSSLVQAALAAVVEIGGAPTLCTIPYCSNGSGSAGELGIPSVVIGPGDSSLFHVVDERINVEQLRRGTEVYARMAVKLLAPS